MPDKRGQTRKTLQALGKRVKRLRLDRGWNRTTLAERAHVTITTIRGCEEGRQMTQRDKLEAIARALQVAVSRLETPEEKDPRVQYWTEEDYEIGTWYHNAPRALKNRIWALQQIAEAGKALLDPQFTELLEAWSSLTPDQKGYIVMAFEYSKKLQSDAKGTADALTPADPKARGPQR